MDESLLENWFLKRDLSKSSRVLYHLVIKIYTEVTGLTLTELKEEAKLEEQNGVWIDDRKIQIHMLKFKKYLEETNRAPNTRCSYFNAVRSFYRSQGIQIPDIKMPKGDICLEENYTKLLTKDDIRKMIDVSTPRDRAIIYVMALSGMSQAEMRKLTILKVLDAITDNVPEIETLKDLFRYEKKLKNTILTLTITRKKEYYRYHTFIPPEAIYSIIAYLRERCFGKNENIRIHSYDTPIFVSKIGRKLTTKNISTVFVQIGKRAGYKKKYGMLSPWRSHALRKFFISTIIKHTGDHMLADYLTGHKIPDVKRAYWIIDPEDLKKKYMDILPQLSIDGVKFKVLESDEHKKIENMEKSMKDYQQRILDLEQDKEDLKETKSLLDKILSNPEVLKELNKLNK